MSTTENPFASPHADAHFEVETNLKKKPVPASQGSRFANMIIDGIVINVGAFMVGMVFGVLFLATGGDIESEEGIVFDLLARLLGVAVFVMYYMLLEVTTGRTLGKLITGTKVVNEQGGVPTGGQIVGRSFARLIPFEAFSFLGTPCRGWHDSLSKTYVVKAR